MKCLYLLVALVTAAQALRSSFMVITPNAIRPGMNLGVSIHCLKLEAPMIVRVLLFRNRVRVTYRSALLRTGRPNPTMLKLWVPPDTEQGQFTITATGRGYMTFSTSKSISFVPKDKSLFIQSDKAIYKPGDMVQFRSLSLLPTLMPYTGGVNISVHDSASNKIYQWMEAKGPYGVVSKDFELSSRPVMGDWKITVESGTQKVEKTISIAEYVLPKFEVQVKMPSYILTTTEEISFKVKATYTYGKPVSGHMNVYGKLVYQSQDYEQSTRKEFFHLSDDIEGEKEIIIQMETLKKAHSYVTSYKIAIKAEVVETETGNVMIEYGYVTIERSGVNMVFPPINPDSFKPGLLYSAYLSVTQPDKRPLGVLDEEVEVTISVTAPLSSKTTTRAAEPTTTPGTGTNTMPMMTTAGPPTTQMFQEFPYPHPVQQDYTYELKKIKLSIPANGLALFSFAVPIHAKTIRMNARYEYAFASKTLEQSHSPSGSFMQISLSEFTTIKAGDKIVFSVNSTMPLPTLHYQIMSRGNIIRIGQAEGLTRREFSFTMETTTSMAPNARILIYYVREDGEIVTDTIGFDISGSFQNDVDLRIAVPEAEPGQEVRFHITAAPTSHAFLLALDQSVLLLKSGNDITPDDVYNELEQYDTIDHQNDYILRSPAGMMGQEPEEEDFRVQRSIWWPYPIFFGGSDAYTIFKTAGVIVLTDALVYKYVPPPPLYPYPVTRIPEMLESQVDESAPAGGGGLQAVARIRTEFPETWIWTEVRTCDSGEALVVAKAPDTITSWIASVFAVHNELGFGISSTTSKLRVFRPFFISLNLPYSVVRGEYIAIQVIVFNYMDEDQLVKVTMPKSYEYYNIYIDCNGVEDRLQEDQVHTFMVASGKSRSVYFPIVPILLGNIDIEVRAQSTIASDGVRRQLLVEAEGVAMEFNKAVLVDLTSKHNLFQESFSIELPPNVVEGSTMARISAIGDIMGPSISGLDKLLRLPTGCGEQTLLSLAPNVYITQYLEKTSQLTGAIRDKAMTFMQKGYQQELTFKHGDGSFSAFGTHDQSGSMWLTAFVAKVFHQASAYVFVDERVIKTAISWMISKQETNGSFPEPGRVIHKNMQGRGGSGLALTTFVLIALYENENLYTQVNNTESERYHLARSKALALVQSEVGRSDDLYLMTMAVYAYQLAGSEHLSGLLLRLSQRATNEGGFTYWHLPEEKKETPGSWHYPIHGNALDLEVTSYVLLTLAVRKDLTSGRNILQWVTQQRNPRGGFYSTQDTVMALQALSEFAELVYSDMFNINAKVTFDEESTYTFNINQKNALVTQRRQTKVVPTHVDVTAQGQGLGLIEVAVTFNVEKEIEDAAYHLEILTMDGSMNNFTLRICTSRLGAKAQTGMVVAEIGTPSGFEVDTSSITQLDIIKRNETYDRRIVLYLDELTSEPVCIEMRLERVMLVAKSRPAVVRIYDYYDPGYQVTGFYVSGMLQESTICNVCEFCEFCKQVNEKKEEETTTQTSPEIVS